MEVSLGRIKSLEDVIQWISGTYLAIRLPKNPAFYGLQRSQTNTSMGLESEPTAPLNWPIGLCLNALDKLKSIGALKVLNEDQTIVPNRRLILISYPCFILHLVAGKLMCEHFLSASTVESFLCLTGSETLVDLVSTLN